MAGFPTLKGSWPWPWPWIGSYCIPSCITHGPLPTRQTSLKSKKLFVDERTDVGPYERTYVRTDGRTDERTDGRTFENDFIRSTLSNSRPKKLNCYTLFIYFTLLLLYDALININLARKSTPLVQCCLPNFPMIGEGCGNGSPITKKTWDVYGFARRDVSYNF